MAVTHPDATRNALANLVGDQLNLGTLVFYQANGTTEVATLTFGADAFIASASGEAIANAITSDTNATGGTTTIAKFLTSGATELVACSVGSSGADINLSTNVVPATGTVDVTLLTYTASN